MLPYLKNDQKHQNEYNSEKCPTTFIQSKSNVQFLEFSMMDKLLHTLVASYFLICETAQKQFLWHDQCIQL